MISQVSDALCIRCLVLRRGWILARNIHENARDKSSRTKSISMSMGSSIVSDEIERTNYARKSTASCDITASNQHEALADVMTPLWKMTYTEQLQKKYYWTEEVIDQINLKLRLFERNTTHTRTVAPKIRKVIPSPLTEAYRNKDEFGIKIGVDGNPKTVGFFIGKFVSANTVCVPATLLINIKQEHKDVAECFQEFLQTSALDPFSVADGKTHGNWKLLVVRSNTAGQLQATVVCHPLGLSETQLQDEQRSLAHFFTDGPGQRCHLNSLFFQACPHTKCTNEQAPFQMLFGQPFLTEHLLGNTFCISPDSFFQINTPAAEILYETILQNARITPITTLLDVCCGIGPISILASGQARGCVGIEGVPGAVNDAKRSATLNQVSNVDFFCGLVENKLPAILKKLDLANDIATVINPGRAGLTPKALQFLIDCPQISRLLYISCKADLHSTSKNFAQLIVNGKFQLTSIIPVDLFPHTNHTELILIFRR